MDGGPASPSPARRPLSRQVLGLVWSPSAHLLNLVPQEGAARELYMEDVPALPRDMETATVASEFAEAMQLTRRPSAPHVRLVPAACVSAGEDYTHTQVCRGPSG